MRHQSDFLVLGSGIAGLSFALQAARHGSVTVLAKRGRSESNTAYAQGGIAAVLSPSDSFAEHIRDTLIAGAGLCREAAVRVAVEEGPARVRELIELGAEFTREPTALECRHAWATASPLGPASPTRRSVASLPSSACRARAPAVAMRGALSAEGGTWGAPGGAVVSERHARRR